MRPVVAKLTDAEAKLLTNCLELAIEFETGGKMNQGKAEKGLRIFNLLQKLSLDTVYEKDFFKDRSWKLK